MSDLDLAILGEPPLPFGRYDELREAFDESDLRFRVDLTDFARSAAHIQTRIAQTGVPLPTTG
ncbi:MAG: hypothetical protein SFX74_08665 [Fimbriimonadaceae bacterium]|nr:hypothetical protein [Fimbriimonadaceae bacterium]